jgi:hypothetical protein
MSAAFRRLISVHLCRAPTGVGRQKSGGHGDVAHQIAAIILSLRSNGAPSITGQSLESSILASERLIGESETKALLSGLLSHLTSPERSSACSVIASFFPGFDLCSDRLQQ